MKTTLFFLVLFEHCELQFGIVANTEQPDEAI